AARQLLQLPELEKTSRRSMRDAWPPRPDRTHCRLRGPLRRAAPSYGARSKALRPRAGPTPRGLRSAARRWDQTGAVPAPAERHFANANVAEPLGAFSDGLAAEAEIESASAVIVGQCPDHQAPQAKIGKALPRSLEQFLAKTEPLVDGMEVELEDLPLEGCAPRAAAPI